MKECLRNVYTVSLVSKRHKAALALAEGQSQQSVAEAIGVCRKTICNWLCVTEFLAEVDRLSRMIDISSRAERLRIAMRVVRQRVRADGTVRATGMCSTGSSSRRSETTGFKLGYSKGELAELDAQFEALWKGAVEEEVNSRIAARGLTLEVQHNNGSQRQILYTSEILLLASEIIANQLRSALRRNVDVNEVEGLRDDEQS